MVFTVFVKNAEVRKNDLGQNRLIALEEKQEDNYYG